MQETTKLRLLYFACFVDILALAILIPVMPYIAKEFGATPSIQGLLVSTYGGAQIIGGPIMGKLSDRWKSRKKVFLISLFGCIISYGMVDFTNKENFWHSHFKQSVISPTNSSDWHFPLLDEFIHQSNYCWIGETNFHS